MDGVGIVSVMQLGVQGVQFGMVFLLCLELVVDVGYCVVIYNSFDGCMVLIFVIFGCLVCCLVNVFCVLGEGYLVSVVLDYLLVYDIGKVLVVVVKVQGVYEYGVYWVGQGVGLICECDVVILICQLVVESGWN